MKNILSRKIIAIITLFTMLLSVFTPIIEASVKVTGINAFPASYKTYLNQLQSLHPNWTFTALNTGLNWYDVIANETTDRKSLIPLSYPGVWKLNDIQIESGWVNASNIGVQYAMDPRNYLTEEQIFQFESLSYNAATHNQAVVDNIFYSTNMYQRLIEYLSLIHI